MVANVSYVSDGSDQEQVHYVNNQNYNYRPNNLPTHYHPGLRNHENFSYVSGTNEQAEKQSFGKDISKYMSRNKDRYSNKYRPSSVRGSTGQPPRRGFSLGLGSVARPVYWVLTVVCSRSLKGSYFEDQQPNRGGGRLTL
ncbi:hypothetical protein TIFTF001_016224 [Ficus carica]|uniref:Uncharacterized protein n=1 Tax=Ficus carica TaxID=3494 RepID=A0AA88DIT1_FICCA|nr:hypothetical protein TIFTF001_016224 [Ficus carica]